MATITGSQGANASPASALMGTGAGTGVIDTELIARGWEFLFELPVGKTGAAGPVQVWVPPLTKIGDVSVDPGTRTTLGTLNVACKATVIGNNGTALAAGGTSFTVVESVAPPATPFYAHINTTFQNEILLVTNRVLSAGSTYTYTVTRNQFGTGVATLSYGAGSCQVTAVDFTAIVDETATPPATPFWVEMTSASGYTEAMLVTSRVVVAGSQYTYTLDRAVKSPNSSSGAQVNTNHVWGTGFLEGMSGHLTTFQAMALGTNVYLVDNVMQVTETPGAGPKTQPVNIKVGTEWMRVGVRSVGTAVGDYKYLMRRGFKGSTPAAHSVGADVYAPPFYLTLERDDANARVIARVCMDQSDSGRVMGEVSGAIGSSTANIVQAVDNANLGGREAGQYSTRSQIGSNAGSGAPFSSSTQSRGNANTSAAGFSYVLNITSTLFSLATRSGAVNSYCIAGQASSVADMTSESPLFLAWHPTNGIGNVEGASNNYGMAQTVFEYGTSAVTGTFFHLIGPPFVPFIGGSTSFGGYDQLGPAVNGGSHKFLTQSKAFPAYLHGSNGQSNNMNFRSGTAARAYLPDYITFAYNTEPVVGDTIVVGATTYYVLGSTSGSVSARVPRFAVAVKA